MESTGGDLLAQLKEQRDWHKAALFTDKGDIIT